MHCFGILYCDWILLIDGKELEELKIGSKGKDKLYRDEMCSIANLIEEKGKDFAWQIFR